MSSLFRAWHCLRIDPFLFVAKCRARMKRRRVLPQGPVVQSTHGAQFKYDFDFDPAIRSMFAGAYELETVTLMRRLLGPGDIFLDIGANIGFMSFVALTRIGRGGRVYAFEPVPRYAQRLRALAALNPTYELNVNECALGKEAGTSRIAVTNLRNVGWNTMVPEFMEESTIGVSHDVRVERGDEYIAKRGISGISLIKIDTEGYEFPVLQGLSGYFEDSDERPPIICEIAPDAYSLLGNTLENLVTYMEGFGYKAYDIVRPHKPLDLTALTVTTNVYFQSKDEQSD